MGITRNTQDDAGFDYAVAVMKWVSKYILLEYDANLLNSSWVINTH